MEDNSNFFQRANYDQGYWDDYLTARPHYDEPFYQSIFAYHKSKGGSMDLAHDVGTGPGQVAVELSVRFKHVVASDNNPTHLAVAEHRLKSSLSSPQNISLVKCTGEDLCHTYPAGSADLITAAECLPLMDVDKAVETFVTLLKPRGTLAMWFYGRPIFAEPQYASSCQPILDSILDMTFVGLIRGGEPQRRSGWQRATNCMASFLDSIELDSRLWQHVQRRKWNSHHPMPFYSPMACDFEVTRSSRIGTDETLIETDDPGFWQRHWDLSGVRRFMRAVMPTIREDESNEAVELKYRELAQAMGGESAMRKITWPVVLILASKV